MTLKFIVSVVFGLVVFIRTLYGITADQASLNSGDFDFNNVKDSAVVTIFIMSIIYGAVGFMLCNKILSL